MLANPYYPRPPPNQIRENLISSQNNFSNAPYLQSSKTMNSRNFHKDYQNQFVTKNYDGNNFQYKGNNFSSPQYESFYPMREGSHNRFEIQQSNLRRETSPNRNLGNRSNATFYPQTIKKRSNSPQAFCDPNNFNYPSNQPQNNQFPPRNNMPQFKRGDPAFMNQERMRANTEIYENSRNNIPPYQPISNDYTKKVPMYIPNEPRTPIYVPDEPRPPIYIPNEPKVPRYVPNEHNPPMYIPDDQLPIYQPFKKTMPQAGFQPNEFLLDRKLLGFNNNFIDNQRIPPPFSNFPIRDDYLLKPNFKTQYEDFAPNPPFKSLISFPSNELSPPYFNHPSKFLIEEPNKFSLPFGTNSTIFKSGLNDFIDFPIHFPNNGYSLTPPTVSNFHMKTSHINEQKKIHLDKDLDEILDALKEYIFFDRSVQQSKEDLCRRPDFKLIRLIKEFDDNETGQIVFTEFKQSLKKFGVKADDSDISLVINRYSRDGDKKLDYKEFSQMILPSSEINKAFVLGKEENIEKLSPETHNRVAHLFKMLLNCHYSCELLRKDMAEKKINIQKAFDFIANLAKGKVITKEAFMKFFEKYYFYPNKEDIDNLMEIFDRNKSGIINMNEFEYEFNPKLH